ncbi:hypothetical protein [Exiguobacterium sp. ZOR0005]|uniref:hypothetical protein n=1 Tax=Exiguobacterium sp. ZOR0005 TaxID=1339226 RepID=UPI00064555A0|nr:hypothetical protein [Exiguobacterium sp. ZOR0005]
MNVELNETVKQMEILEYFERKYKVKKIITQRTIRNWLKELNIECIHPIPSRNADRRYKKEDIQKLEKEKLNKLLKRRDQILRQKYEEQNSKKVEKVAKDEREKEIKLEEENIRYRDLSKNEQMAEDIMLMKNIQAQEMIEKYMLELCFNALFPHAVIYKEELVKKLIDADSTFMSNETERGSAIDYIRKKLYIKI